MQNWPFSLSYNLFILLTHTVDAYESGRITINITLPTTELVYLFSKVENIDQRHKQAESERGFTQGMNYILMPKFSNYFTFDMGLKKKILILYLYVFLRISAWTLSWSHFFYPLPQGDLTQVHGFNYHSFVEDSHFQISCAYFSLYSVVQEKHLDITLTPLSPF